MNIHRFQGREGGAKTKFRPQFRRLYEIDRLIRDGEYPNYRTLSEKLGISRKTAQRDVELLRDGMQAPIGFDSGRRGFYYTNRTYALPALYLSAGDLFSIFIAEKALAAYENTPVYGHLVSVFDRLAKSLPESGKIWMNAAWLDQRFSFFHEPKTMIRSDVWDSMARGLRLCRTLLIDYKVPGYEKGMPRRVDPYHVAAYQGEWYLIGFCHYRKEILTFAVSRIRKAEMLEDERFDYPLDFDIKEFSGARFGIMWGGKNYRVRVWFSEAIAPYILEREWHPSQKIRKNGDGGIVMTFTANHLLEVMRWILSWGGGARVLAPKELAEAVKRELAEAAGRYTEEKHGGARK